VPELIWAEPVDMKIYVFEKHIGRDDPVLASASLSQNRPIVADAFFQEGAFAAILLLEKGNNTIFTRQGVCLFSHGLGHV
jgi:hypothetical protein